MFGKGQGFWIRHLLNLFENSERSSIKKIYPFSYERSGSLAVKKTRLINENKTFGMIRVT